MKWPHKLISISEAGKEKRGYKNHEFTKKLMIQSVSKMFYSPKGRTESHLQDSGPVTVKMVSSEDTC